MSIFTLAISCLTTSHLPWFTDLTFLCSIVLYSIGLYFFDQRVLFLLWLHLFMLSGVISPLFSSSILGTYWAGEFIFQCHIFLPFHTVHGVLKARILKWFAIPLSSLRSLSTLNRYFWMWDIDKISVFLIWLLRCSSIIYWSVLLNQRFK